MAEAVVVQVHGLASLTYPAALYGLAVNKIRSWHA